MSNERFKFRAWEPVNKEMHYMDFALCNGDRYASKAGTVLRLRYMNLDALSVMQWTGLLDKNGKEIYEGDFVERWVADLDRSTADRIVGVVVYGGFANGTGFSVEKTSIGIAVPLYAADWVVLGNIHENGDLLK